jgi:hypothetical protein
VEPSLADIHFKRHSVHDPVTVTFLMQYASVRVRKLSQNSCNEDTLSSRHVVLLTLGANESILAPKNVSRAVPQEE